ncbi:polysaccharide pyruvyl transferase family protein [Streptomyces sp. NPDC050560]|uniref:polysaccharide pyruvyl transferase family protein n=1 Tax=Streptomyces sp. NPDC050560 TaxID=3365630 RepID=UPI00379D37A8
MTVEDALHQDVIATNSGNLIFSDATHKILQTPGTEVVSNGIQTPVAEAGRINEEFDVFVVPLANAFRPSFERSLIRLTRLISRLRIPVVVAGVGAQTGLDYNPARLAPMADSVRAFVSAVLDRSATIGVRGEFTEKYLRDLGFTAVEVVGCPSLFQDGDTVDIVKGRGLDRSSRIAVNGSHGSFKQKRLARIVRGAWEEYPETVFIGQNLTEARQLHWREAYDAKEAPRSMPTHPEHPMFREGRVRVFVDPVTWIDELRDFDYSFGARIHGNIAALLAGTPATVLCGDSRTLELARYFEIPHRTIPDIPDDLRPEDLFAEADFGPFVKGHRDRFDRFVDFLARNGLDNTFTHGDGGRAFDERMRSLAFPPAVRPWTSAGVEEVSARFAWMRDQMAELAARNAALERRAARTVAAPAAPQSVYRKARRVVGRPIKRALKF